jgi:hypothetical protein
LKKKRKVLTDDEKISKKTKQNIKLVEKKGKESKKKILTEKAIEPEKVSLF